MEGVIASSLEKKKIPIGSCQHTTNTTRRHVEISARHMFWNLHFRLFFLVIVNIQNNRHVSSTRTPQQIRGFVCPCKAQIFSYKNQTIISIRNCKKVTRIFDHVVQLTSSHHSSFCSHHIKVVNVSSS